MLSRVRLCATPWIAAGQASLSLTNSQSLPKLTSIESVMPSNHLCRPLHLLPSIFPSIRVFSNESVLCIRWPKYWSFSFSISPSNEYLGGEDNGTPLQYSCLENPMDRGAWWAAVHDVAKSRTQLSDFTFTFMHWRRKWQPTPVFLPGESQGWRSLVGCRLCGRTEWDTTEVA